MVWKAIALHGAILSYPYFKNVATGINVQVCIQEKKNQSNTHYNHHLLTTAMVYYNQLTPTTAIGKKVMRVFKYIKILKLNIHNFLGIN